MEAAKYKTGQQVVVPALDAKGTIEDSECIEGIHFYVIRISENVRMAVREYNIKPVSE